MKQIHFGFPNFIIRHKNIIIEILCSLFIILFVYAAISKLIRYDVSVIRIAQSPMLSNNAVTIAWAIPTIELIIAGMLVFKSFRKYGLYGFFTMMVIFTAYIVAILEFSERIPCSCGGVLQKLGWTEHLIFNICFVLLGAFAIQLYLFNEKPKISTKKNTPTSTSQNTPQKNYNIS